MCTFLKIFDSFFELFGQNVRIASIQQQIQVVFVAILQHLRTIANRVGSVLQMQIAFAGVRQHIQLNVFVRLFGLQNFDAFLDALHPLFLRHRFGQLVAQLCQLFNVFVEREAALVIGIQFQTFANLTKI